MATTPICSVENCDKPAASGRRGYCSAHYKRWYRYGDPTTQKKIPNGEAVRFLEEVVFEYEGSGCLTWPYSRTTAGYGRLLYKGKYHHASRLACEVENGPAPTDRHEAAHSCGKGHLGCVARKHMRWATPTENQADKLKHGTMTRGEKHGNAKLTEEDVHEIRAMKGKLYQREIAEIYGVSPHLIGLIHRGERWGWLK